ncbi:unnamed protein product [marine sediment metagenome]|uniref:Uncharacterized protein n=1 Tax=marine sediment metagenome TaxID=412755 RepID=X1N9H9_9ZZZZ
MLQLKLPYLNPIIAGINDEDSPFAINGQAPRVSQFSQLVSWTTINTETLTIGAKQL